MSGMIGEAPTLGLGVGETATAAVEAYPRIKRAGDTARGAIVGSLVDGTLYRVLGEVPEHLATQGARFEGLAGLTWIEPHDAEGPDGHLSPGAPVFVHRTAEEASDE